MKYSYEYKKQCVELYRQGRWPETPEGVSKDWFHRAVVEWHRLEKACGTEALRHKKQNSRGKIRTGSQGFSWCVMYGNSNSSGNQQGPLVPMGQML